MQIDGRHWAGSFAFNAFFSLFPLFILSLILASFFVERESAGRAIVTYLEGYVPLDSEMRPRIFGAITGVIQASGQVGLVTFFILVWTALQCFTTLVRVTNRAWDDQAYNWWRLPLRGMALLGVTAGAVLLGMAATALTTLGESWLSPVNAFVSLVFTLLDFIIPPLVLFLSLTFFYRLAPSRTTRFAEVWVAAIWTTVLLQTTQILFVVYLKHFATLNDVYGMFGGIMALLLWIYLSGCVFIFGACLCAALAEGRSASTKALIAFDPKMIES
jgi:YihY family inner membrane protein